ncbi:MAG: ATP-binding protein [Candidatus Erginobacter occultus]|nr:ATP-binding protein [Candidatus Erginobacter occultus]
MLLKRMTKFRRSLVFRLALWYAGVFALVTLILFALLYFMIRSYIYGRIDDYLEAEAEESRVLLAAEGLEEIKDEIIREETAHGDNKIFFRLVTPTGLTLASSDMAEWGSYLPQLGQLQLTGGKKVAWTTEFIPGDHHMTRIIHALIGPGVIMEIGQTLRAEAEFMEVFWRNFVAVLLFGISVTVVVGWFMGRRALGGVQEVTRTAIRITGGGFKHRVPVRGTGDEIDHLAEIFNDMLDRIQTLITGMKEVNDNIAHDLRSPITRIRGLAETMLAGKDTVEDYRSMGGSTVEECDRLLQMINTMLDISEMDAGVAKSNITEINISEMLKETGDLFQPVAEEESIVLTVKTLPDIIIPGDIRKMQRALANLLDNALKYTRAGGTVVLAADAGGEQIRISISDTGMGIPPAELPHIFERFFRGQQNRTREGSGLGLSLARSIIRSHGGDISVESNPGTGSEFTITLPRPSSPDSRE